MFYQGVAGDYNLRLMNSPSYEGPQDLTTYPKYNKSIMGYINRAIEHTRNCKNLPLKRHFNSFFYPYYIKACRMYEEKAKLLKEIQQKRHALFSQERCKDITPEIVQAHCPEMDVLDEELISTYNSIEDEKDKIFYPIRDQLGLPSD